MLKSSELLDSKPQKVETEICIGCGSRKRLLTHHIFPRCFGGGDNEENLLTLCRSCHPGWERSIKNYIRALFDPKIVYKQYQYLFKPEHFKWLCNLPSRWIGDGR